MKNLAAFFVFIATWSTINIVNADHDVTITFGKYCFTL